MGSMNLLLSLFGWTFVPDFATKHLLNFIYQSPIRIVTPPQPGSVQHRKHYAVAFAFVIFAYLTYTLVQSARAMPPNFYQILGVPPDVDENGLKLAFRAFAKRYHPDRPGVGRQGAEMFMYVRDAFEALKDPVVRFAYDRFGPDAVAWRQHCKTTREFLRQGLMVSSGYHIVAGIALLFWSAIGKPSTVSFWRYVLFAALLAGELSFILSPFPAVQTAILPPADSFLSFLSRSSTTTLSTPTLAPTSSYSILQRIFPNRVPYQHILFLHQVFMFLSVALSRVVPQVISLLSEDGTDSRELEPVERAIWERIYGTIAIADREASLILHTILQSINPTAPSTSKPCHDPTLARMQPLSPAKTAEALDKLSPEMQALVVEANIKNHMGGPIASACEAALKKSRSIFSPSRSSSQSMQTPGKVKQEIPQTPRTREFWEKEPGDGEEVIALASDEPGAASTPTSSFARVNGSPPMLPRTPSMTRIANNMGSPKRVQSPARRSSFGPAAGEF